MRSSNTNSLHFPSFSEFNHSTSTTKHIFQLALIFHQLFNYYIYNLRLFLYLYTGTNCLFKCPSNCSLHIATLFLSSFQWTLPSLLIFHYFPYSLPANLAFVFKLKPVKRLSKLQILRLLTNIIPHFTCLLKNSRLGFWDIIFSGFLIWSTQKSEFNSHVAKIWQVML